MLNIGGLIAESTALAILFSSPDCGVCHAIHPKLDQLFAQRFPEINYCQINLVQMREQVADFALMTAPTLVIYFEGQECLRYSHGFSLLQVSKEVARLYALCFKVE